VSLSAIHLSPLPPLGFANKADAGELQRERIEAEQWLSIHASAGNFSA
jgi:hypothetical protein